MDRRSFCTIRSLKRSLQQQNSLEQNARFFALVDLSMADAGISAWNAKYSYDFWRPVTGNPAGQQRR